MKSIYHNNEYFDVVTEGISDIRYIFRDKFEIKVYGPDQSRPDRFNFVRIKSLNSQDKVDHTFSNVTQLRMIDENEITKLVMFICKEVNGHKKIFEVNAKDIRNKEVMDLLYFLITENRLHNFHTFNDRFERYTKKGELNISFDETNAIRIKW